jgi:hypothetical protein
MNHPFFDRFRFGPYPPPLLYAEVRGRLEQAILANDAFSFQTELKHSCSEIASEHRLYGVLIKTIDGIKPIMVDETGKKLGAGSSIPKGIPIHLLNVEYTPTDMRVTIGGDIWVVPNSSTNEQVGDDSCK